MKITEELLKDLGFVQHGHHVWDYKVGTEHNYFRFYKSGEQWSFVYRRTLKESIRGPGEGLYPVNDFMEVMLIVSIAAHANGKREIQDKLHESLGLDGLLERFRE